MATGKFVAYYRVSTARQGRSGLGQAAQKEAVAAYLNDGSWQLLAEYRDVESGKNDDRPELRRALDHCRMTGARLLIAKLDRLSRNVAFIAEMMQAGVKFTAVDMPDANELTIHIMAAVAQAERKAISERTRVALAAAKTRGTKLGNPDNLRNQRKGSKRGNERKAQLADNAASLVLAPIREARRQGATSLRAVADALNAAGYTTPRGAQWTATQVMRAEKRLAA